MPRLIMFWTIDLIGANPVPVATNTIGLGESSRRKNSPNGTSTSSLSPVASDVRTSSEKRPPGTWRICNSALSLSCGGLAMEKLRLSPSAMMTRKYCPARNLARVPAGKRNCRMTTSGVGRWRRNTRAVMRLRANGSRLSMRARLDREIAKRLCLAQQHAFSRAADPLMADSSNALRQIAGAGRADAFAA